MSGSQTTESPVLTLVWNDYRDIPVNDARNVDLWNVYFDTANQASAPFESVEIELNTVSLFGAKDLIISEILFRYSEIAELNGDAITEISDGAFSGCFYLYKISLPCCNKIGDAVFTSCPNIEVIELPICTIIGENNFNICATLRSIELPQCLSLGNFSFVACPNLISISLPLCNSIGNDSFTGGNLLRRLELPNCESIGDSCFMDCYFLENLRLPLCQTIGSNSFSSSSALKIAFLPMCENLGPDESNNNIFQYVNTLVELTVPVSLSTIDNGAPDGDLVHALSNNPSLALNGITYV